MEGSNSPTLIHAVSVINNLKTSLKELVLNTQSAKRCIKPLIDLMDSKIKPDPIMMAAQIFHPLLKNQIASTDLSKIDQKILSQLDFYVLNEIFVDCDESSSSALVVPILNEQKSLHKRLKIDYSLNTGKERKSDETATQEYERYKTLRIDV